MTGRLKALRVISLLLIAAGAAVYIIYPGANAAISLLLGTGFALMILWYIFTYRQSYSGERRRTARLRTGTYISSLIVLAVIILLQAVIVRHNVRIDTTYNSRFSLSEKTSDLLSQLESDISLIGFYRESGEQKKLVEDLFSNFREASGRIDYRFVNPDREPAVARRYRVERFGVTVIESEAGYEKLTGVNESKLTNSIYRAISRRRLKIYFMTGHGERSIENDENIGFSRLAELLREENFIITELSLGTGEGIPEDCNILISAGPQNDLLPFEKERISDYLARSGRALFLIDPLTDSDNITELLSNYGLVPENSIIVDRSGMLTSGSYLTPVVNRYGGHAITDGFTYFSFFPQARSVRIVESAEGYNVTGLCYTNKNAYSETALDLVLEGRTKFDGGADRPGPIPLAAVSSTVPEPAAGRDETRIALFGDSDFASNKIIDLYGNRDLAMNTINWLARRENLITIRGRNNLVQPVLLTMRQGRLVNYLSMAVLPAIVILIGVFVLARKKRNSSAG